MNKSPAFQLYAADFYMDTLAWDAETVGVYFRLLMHEWVNGYVPDDIEKIARISGMMVDRKWRSNMTRIWSELCTKFVAISDGNLVNVRLEETRSEQTQYRDKQRESGKIGAKKRWKTDSDPIGNPNGESIALLTSTSSSLSINNNTIEPKPKKKKQFVIPTIEEISIYCKERKNNVNPQVWLDHYESNGWMVGKNKMNNWKAAIRTWEHRKFDDGGSYGRGKGVSNGGFGNKPEPAIIPEYTGEDIPTEEERQRGLQRLQELKQLAGRIG